ncbi:sigma D regulator [Pseudidiomarina terrestris]|uniref:sigma D regulator n=1 Tax=Pseudidiomarina terrestris TaxID=2820060 RepID=UPI00264C657C|nr:MULTISPECIES: sigma D regulator [unclassified Pseudidiomarina]MDN7135815.1 sigma D regulator [Pseudidiomarina sp. 1ASP75-5]MEA3587975.1 sigma D regulator [Pseudidiomarina sp. 1APP75-27a]
MLKRQEQAKQRWGGAHQAIDTWLQERQLLLIEYFKLAGLPPYDKETSALPAAEDVRNFCGLLVDYVSAGHFEIYDQIIANCGDKPAETEELAAELFPLISETTEVALAFHDQYGNSVDDTHFDDFDRHLSGLAEALELRMEFEDRLLHALEQHRLL